MSSFHDVSFPLGLAFGASGGPARETHITPLASGGESRNNPHAQSRRHYNAAAGLKSHKDLQKLVSFFEARFGQLYSFRFKDPVDHLSCEFGKTPSALDQNIATGDGQSASVQLSKIYADSAGSYRRKITKPMRDSVLLAIDGAELTPNDYAVDYLTGRVSLTTPPPSGARISAGFAFDVAVRFAADRLELSLEAFGAGELAHVPLVEVLDA